MPTCERFVTSNSAQIMSCVASMCSTATNLTEGSFCSIELMYHLVLTKGSLPFCLIMIYVSSCFDQRISAFLPDHDLCIILF